EKLIGESHHLAQHPVAADHDDEPDPDQLGHEGERDLLDLRDGLEQRHRQADPEADEQDRRAELGADDHGLNGDLDDAGVHSRPLPQAKLLSRERTMSPQPSTITNSRILNGRETSTGGSIIIPMDMSELETTMSMTRKGMKMTKPMMKAGISAARLTSSGLAGFWPLPAAAAALTNSDSSSLRVCFSMNVRSGVTAAS